MKIIICYSLSAEGFILINQYEKAERIHRKLIPYLQCYRRSYLLAEILFQQAIIYWEERKQSDVKKYDRIFYDKWRVLLCTNVYRLWK